MLSRDLLFTYFWAIFKEKIIGCCMKNKGYTKLQKEIAKYAKAFSHPARIAILELLVKQCDCICNDLVESLPLAQSTVSQHLKILKEVGLMCVLKKHLLLNII